MYVAGNNTPYINLHVIKWRKNFAMQNIYSNNIYLLTYLITPYSRVLLEKLTGFQLVKKFPTIYGNRRFITAFTSACHLSLS